MIYFRYQNHKSPAIFGSNMPVNWDAQRNMDRDVEENADLYAALADEDDED